MSDTELKASVELMRPFLVFKDSKGKRLCINPKHIASVLEVSDGIKIETISGNKWFIKMPLEELIDKTEEANYLF